MQFRCILYGLQHVGCRCILKWRLPVFPPGKFYTEQKFVSTFKFGVLQVRENELSLRKCSGGTLMRSCAPEREKLRT